MADDDYKDERYPGVPVYKGAPIPPGTPRTGQHPTPPRGAPPEPSSPDTRKGA